MGALTIDPHQTQWTTEQLQALDIPQTVPTADLLRFLHVCQATGLDPFARQVYLTAREDRRNQRTVYPILGSIDGFRIVAQRSGEYEGQTEPQWCGADGTWTEVWLAPDTPPAACRIGVWRSGFRQPLVAIALWREYGSGNGMWRSMPAHMLAKVAEALALRKAFPQDLASIYTSEEMDQSGDVAPTPPNTEPDVGQGAASGETVWDVPLAMLSRATNQTELIAAWHVGARRNLLDQVPPDETKPFRKIWEEARNAIQGLGQAADQDGRPPVAPETWETVYKGNGEIDMVATLRNRVTWIKENPDKIGPEDLELAEQIAQAQRARAAKEAAEEAEALAVAAENIQQTLDGEQVN